MLYISWEGSVHRASTKVTDQDSRSTLPELRDTRSYSIQRVFVYREEIEFIETDDMRYPSCLPVAPSGMDASRLYMLICNDWHPPKLQAFQFSTNLLPPTSPSPTMKWNWFNPENYITNKDMFYLNIISLRGSSKKRKHFTINSPPPQKQGK